MWKWKCTKSRKCVQWFRLVMCAVSDVPAEVENDVYSLVSGDVEMRENIPEWQLRQIANWSYLFIGNPAEIYLNCRDSHREFSIKLSPLIEQILISFANISSTQIRHKS